MEATVWHYLLALPLLLLLGCLVHCARAWFNIFPDRYNLIPDRPWLNHKLDDLLSANYGFWDMVVATEYDEEGFYEFFSRRNWRNMCIWTVAIGYAMLFGYPDLESGYVSIVNQTPAWLWELLKYRIENLRLL